MVRLQCYLRQLVAETPAQKLRLCAAMKRKDWGVLVSSMDAEVGEMVALEGGRTELLVLRRASGVFMYVFFYLFFRGRNVVVDLTLVWWLVSVLAARSTVPVAFLLLHRNYSILMYCLRRAS